MLKALVQGSTELVSGGPVSCKVSSNPNQTHVEQLIKVLFGILETSRQVYWGKVELNSAGHRPSRTPALGGVGVRILSQRKKKSLINRITVWWLSYSSIARFGPVVPAPHPDTFVSFCPRVDCRYCSGLVEDSPFHNIPWLSRNLDLVLYEKTQWNQMHSQVVNLLSLFFGWWFAIGVPFSSSTQIPNIRKIFGDSKRFMVSTSLLKTLLSSLEKMNKCNKETLVLNQSRKWLLCIDGFHST